LGSPGEGPYGVTLRGAEVWTTLVHAGAVARLADGTVDPAAARA
jgi:virginiamycin B lyase